MMLRLTARFIISIVQWKTARFITEWVTTQSARFLARHHWHNANQKRAVLIKRAKICYV